MELTDTLVAWLLVGLAGGVLVAIALAVFAITGQRRVRRSYRMFAGDHGEGEDVLALLEQHITEVRTLRGQVASIGQRSDQMRDLIAGTVSRVATLRYDAFDDVGGHMSYSTALLDEQGNGVVLTSIHGRSDTRTYAKPVERGQSDHTLSGEEAAVIATALDKRSAPHHEAPSASTS